MARFSVLLLLTAMLSGCVSPTTQRIKVDNVAAEIEAKKQREVAVQSLMEDRVRLFKVAYPLLTRTHALCGEKTRYLIGMLVANNEFFGPEFREAANSAFGLTDTVRVLQVMPGSPADAAAIKANDVLLTLNAWLVPVGAQAMKLWHEKLAEASADGKPMALAMQRGAERREAPITPVKACDYLVTLSNDDAINAYADGSKVVITRGMMRFAKDDVELSLVVAHELAHNAMKHRDALTTNYVLGSIFDILAAAYGVNTQGAFGNIAAGVHSQDFEAEADYVGLYMMAQAGLEIQNAPNFWRRMAAAHPNSIGRNHATSHPSTPHRFIALEEAVKEIKAKQASGAPLQLELKKGKVAEETKDEAAKE